MFINKKSQSSLEFLMNYGWAILLVMVVLGALAYIAIPYQRLSPPKCFFPSGIACLGTQVSPTQAKIVVKNTFEPIMYVISVNSTGMLCSIATTPWLIDTDNTITCDVTPLNLTDRAKIKLQIYYNKESGGLTKVVTGEFFNYVR